MVIFPLHATERFQEIVFPRDMVFNKPDWPQPSIKEYGWTLDPGQLDRAEHP